MLSQGVVGRWSGCGSRGIQGWGPATMLAEPGEPLPAALPDLVDAVLAGDVPPPGCCAVANESSSPYHRPELRPGPSEGMGHPRKGLAFPGHRFPQCEAPGLPRDAPPVVDPHPCSEFARSQASAAERSSRCRRQELGQER